MQITSEPLNKRVHSVVCVVMPVCIPLFFCAGFGFELVLDDCFLFVCALAVKAHVPVNVISVSNAF